MERRTRHLRGASNLQTSLSAVACADLNLANVRIFRDNFGKGNFSVKTADWLAERADFELAVRLAKFAFDFLTEFRVLVATSGFRENFAREVLNETIRLVSAVRFLEADTLFKARAQESETHREALSGNARALSGPERPHGSRWLYRRTYFRTRYAPRSAALPLK